MKQVAILIIALLAIGKGLMPDEAQATALAQAETEYVLPTQMCRGYFFVPVTLEVREGDSPEARTLWFLYDTGASASYVDPDSIERVSGQSLDSGVRANFGTATSGDLHFTGLRARVRNLDHLSIALGREIDGILEFGAFANVLLTLDYANSEMRVVSGVLPRPDRQTVFDANGPDDRPWIRIGFPGRNDRRLLIDSGAALSPIILRRIDRYDTVAPPRTTGAAVRFSEVEERRSARLRNSLWIGPNELEQPIVQSTPETEILGGQAMRHFSWTFDQRNERVRVIPNDPDTPVRFDPLVNHGMVLVPEGDGMRVSRVLTNSPAFDAGVEQGDFVTRFNGQSVRTRSCEMGSEPPSSMELTLLRRGETINITLDLYPLVD